MAPRLWLTGDDAADTLLTGMLLDQQLP